MIYLYAKDIDRLDVFEPVFDALRLPMSDYKFTSENMRSWHELDNLIGMMIARDGLCVPSLEQIGADIDSMAVRIALILDRNGAVAVASIPATYEFGLDIRLNHAVISAVMQGVKAGSGGQPFMPRIIPGRPKMSFPDGWGELYSAWERGTISSKEFLERSGLKKATFYNKIADYRELRDFNARYMLEHKLA